MPKIKDLSEMIGVRYGMLTPIEDLGIIENNNKKNHYLKCRCDCGNIIECNYIRLLNKGFHNCGCQTSRIARENGNIMKKYNTYDLSGEYGIGWTTKGEEFYFDLEDYDLIKDYCWYVKVDKNNPELKYLTDRHDERMHRLVMGLKRKQDSHIKVDHIGHNTLDNRKSQLRITTNLENCDNQSTHKNNTSGVSGVTKHKDGGWVSRIGYNNERIYLGYFDDFDDAVKARKEAEEKYFGEFSYDNSMKYVNNN